VNSAVVPAACIFDMDGLMLDTERPAIRFWLMAAAEYGYPMDESIPVSTVGMDEGDTRRRVMEACGPDFPYEAVRARLGVLYAESMEREGVGRKPGLEYLLDQLDGLGIILAVATSTPRAQAIARLDRAGILDRFKALACGDEVSRGKPAPDIYLLAADRLGMDPVDCVGFEDSDPGLRSLASAGIRSVFVKDMADPSPETLSTVWRSCATLRDAAGLFQVKEGLGPHPRRAR